MKGMKEMQACEVNKKEQIKEILLMKNRRSNQDKKNEIKKEKNSKRSKEW